MSALERLGWRRVDGYGPGKLHQRWRHPAGWELHHCGHPTALHPWALYDPAGALILTGVTGPARRADFGTAWNTLEEAAAYVDSTRAERDRF